MAYEEVGQATLRATIYDGAVKQIAARAYKFKQAVSVVSTGAWKNYFFRESTTPLTGATTTGITTNLGKGIPRLAEFPQASASWERVLATIEKFGMQDIVPWEDILSNEIDVRNRTLIKITEAVVKSVDDTIWNGLTENRAGTNIQSFAITNGYQWDTASAAIIDDLERAEALITTYNYDTSNLMVFVSPTDKRRVVNYLYGKGAQAPDVATRMIDGNGVIGKLGNKTFVVSNSVTASYALVVVPQRCATWKELVPLKTDVTTKPFIGDVITAVELGVLQLTDPKAVVMIANTASA